MWPLRAGVFIFVRAPSDVIHQCTYDVALTNLFSVCGSYEHIPEGELLILDDSAFKERKRREEKRKPLGGIQERKHYSEPKGGGGSERKQRTQGGMGGWESTQLFCNSLGPRILLLLSRTGFQLFPGYGTQVPSRPKEGIGPDRPRIALPYPQAGLSAGGGELSRGGLPHHTTKKFFTPRLASSTGVQQP